MRHAPTANELEGAIVDVLAKSPNKNLTAKEVRQHLLKEKGGWKVPGERRIAKFVKRQNSFKKQRSDSNGKENGGTKNGRMLGRIFQKTPSQRNNNGSISSLSETHPKNGLQAAAATNGKSSSAQRQQYQQQQHRRSDHGSVGSSSTERRSVRNFLAKALSPPSFRKGKHQMPNQPSHESFRRKSGKGSTPKFISYEEVLAERSTVSPSVADTNPPPVRQIETTTKPQPLAVSTGVETAKQNTEKSATTTNPLSAEEAYQTDDNDGKTKKCECQACIIL